VPALMLERECDDHQSSLRPPFTPRHEEKINPAGPTRGEVPLKHEEEAKSSGLRSRRAKGRAALIGL
jgi:hypothetical protein